MRGVVRVDIPPDQSQIDHFKGLARKLGCDEDEAALKQLSDVKPLPKSEPKRRPPPERAALASIFSEPELKSVLVEVERACR